MFASVNPTPQIGSFGSFFGPDMILVFGLQAAVVIGIVLLVRSLVRRGVSKPATPSNERLQRLDALQRSGSITGIEHAEQRRRILAEL